MANKRSAYIITVSTNYKPLTTHESKQIAEELRSSLKNLFSHDGLEDIIEFEDSTHSYDFNVDRVKIEYSIELGKGEKGGRIHAHAHVKIDHTSKIKLDFAKMREIIQEDFSDERLAGKKIYMNVKIASGSKSLRDYIRKDEISL